MPKVYLGIGSNIQRKQHIKQAIDTLRMTFGELQISPIYETEAIGFAGDPFYNCVVGITTEFSLLELANHLRNIEANNGRVRGEKKFSARTLDIDIICYGDINGTVDGIELPRDEVFRYAFVLKPLADIAPDELCPGSTKNWGTLWHEFTGSKTMQIIEDTFLTR